MAKKAATTKTAAKKTSAKKTTAKKTATAKKAATKKAATKKAATETTGSRSRRLNGMTPSQVKTLDALTSGDLNRAQLTDKTGIVKGWSKILGSPNKDGFGADGDTSLEALKYVTSERHEGSRAFTYKITATGKKALTAAQKEAS